MAAAEARAAWQRTPNQCFVQEDATRTSKLACCSSSSWEQQYDSCNSNTTNVQVHPSPNFMPFNWNPMISNLSSDTKWWLQLQPNFGHQKCSKCEQLNDAENELEETNVENTTYCRLGELHSVDPDPMDIESIAKDYPFDSPRVVSTAFMELDSERKAEELKILTGNSQQILQHKMERGNFFSHDEELLDWKSVDELFPQKLDKGLSDLQSPWAAENKRGPWWRVADKDELASLVAERAKEHIENCDLPRPTQTRRDRFSSLDAVDRNRIFSSTVGRNLHTGKCSPSATSGNTDRKHGTFNEGSYLSSGTEKLHSGAYSYNITMEDLPESMTTLDRDPNRARLLEALRHSQTRAREAEMEAQKAYSDKEHTIRLLLRQASHLFAYKQWLHILQLETLSQQLRINSHKFPPLFPILPRIPLKRKPSKMQKKRKCSICKCTILFAVGLGLAGAGLLLGWTLGWLLPAL